MSLSGKGVVFFAVVALAVAMWMFFRLEEEASHSTDSILSKNHPSIQDDAPHPSVADKTKRVDASLFDAALADRLTPSTAGEFTDVEIRDPHGASVPGLSVWVYHRNPQLRAHDYAAMNAGAEQWIRRLGTRLDPDRNGNVLVEHKGSQVFLFAENDDWHGEGWIGLESPVPPLLTVYRRQSLEVRVVDESGSPVVNAPVHLYTECKVEPIMFCANFVMGDRLEAVVATNRQGLARFPRIGRTLSSSRSHTSWPEAQYVCIGSSAQKSDVAWIDPKNLPTDPLELIAPPMGTLILAPCDDQGEPFPEAVTIGVTDPHQSVPRNGARYFWVPADGPLTLQVPADRQLQFHGESLKSGLQSAVDVELQAHSTRRVEMWFAVSLVRVCGRLVDETGEPYANRSLGWKHTPVAPAWQLPGRPEIYQWDSRTDDDGRFEIVARGLPEGSPGFFTLLVAPQGAPQGAQAFATQSVPRSGPWDLGEIVAPTRPLIAWGKVVDANGEPVPEATVTVYRGRVLSSDEKATTNADGEYWIHGEWPLPLRIGAVKNHFATPAKRDLSAVSQNADFVLTEKERWFGKVLLDPHIPHGSVELRVRSESRESQVRQQHGWFWITGLPEPVTLRAFSGTDEQEVWQSSPRKLETGDCSREDPWIIDLRGQLRWTELRVVDTNHEAIAGAFVRLSGERRWLDTDSLGRMNFATSRHHEVEVEFIGRNHGRKTILLEEGIQTVVLADGPALQLAMLPESASPLPSSVRLELEPLSQTLPYDLQSILPQPTEFRESGVIHFRVPEKGEYRIRLIALTPWEGNPRLMTVEPMTDQGPVLDIAPRSHPQRFEWELDATTQEKLAALHDS